MERKSELSAIDADYQFKLREYLQANNPSFIISHDWMANQWLMYFLQTLGYRIVKTEDYADILENGQYLILMKQSEVVKLVRWHPEAPLDLPGTLKEEIQKMGSILYVGPDYETIDYVQKSFLSRDFQQKRLPEWRRFETILFINGHQEYH